MRPIILICIAVFAAAMALVDFGAHKIVGALGPATVLAAIAVFCAVSYWYDHRAPRR